MAILDLFVDCPEGSGKFQAQTTTTTIHNNNPTTATAIMSDPMEVVSSTSNAATTSGASLSHGGVAPRYVFVYSPTTGGRSSSSSSSSGRSSSSSPSSRSTGGDALNELLTELNAQSHLFTIVSSSLSEALHEHEGRLPSVLLLTETTNDKSVRTLIEEIRKKRKLLSLFIAVFDYKGPLFSIYFCALHTEPYILIFSELFCSASRGVV